MGNLNNLRYADDTVLIGECIEDIQRLVKNVVEVSETSGLTRNVGKTKFRICPKHGNVVVKREEVQSRKI